jgi:hypothetical protein
VKDVEKASSRDAGTEMVLEVFPSGLTLDLCFTGIRQDVEGVRKPSDIVGSRDAGSRRLILR